jgi:hypothetical protein
VCLGSVGFCWLPKIDGLGSGMALLPAAPSKNDVRVAVMVITVGNSFVPPLVVLLPRETKVILAKVSRAAAAGPPTLRL